MGEQCTGRAGDERWTGSYIHGPDIIDGVEAYTAGLSRGALHILNVCLSYTIDGAEESVAVLQQAEALRRLVQGALYPHRI